MKKELFKRVFEKAKVQSGKTSKHGLADFLSFKMTNDFQFSISKKTFSRLYERFIEQNLSKGNDPKTDLLNAVSRYLDYKDFEDFVVQNSLENKPLTENMLVSKVNENDNYKNLKVKTRLGNMKIIISIIALSLIIIFSASIWNKPKWMVWKEDHYEKVSFNLKKYDLSQLKIYKAEWIKEFKKINPTCGVTKFFKNNGEPNVWYGKSNEGELEYFTHHGLHPETGKTLKKITDYMIDKYICN